MERGGLCRVSARWSIDMRHRCGTHKHWRRDPESNRGTRLCRPLHNHSAIAPKALYIRRFSKKGKAALSPGIWSGKRVSNSRPQPWQGCALPTELFPQRTRIIAAAVIVVSTAVCRNFRPRSIEVIGHRPQREQRGDIEQHRA